MTTAPFFEIYNQYKIEPDTRYLALQTFLSAAVGFLIGSVAYSRARGPTRNLKIDERIASRTMRWQGLIASAIFLVGSYEFISNWNSFANLLELRLAAVSGDLVVGSVSRQFFYFAMAFVMLIGFSDGFYGRISRAVAAMSVIGLIMHNLSIGGRINVVIAPALYLLPMIISASQRTDWAPKRKRETLRLVVTAAILILILFSAIRLLRSVFLDPGIFSNPVQFLLNVLFAIPMYVSDTFISISIHTSHAREAALPFGYFTFDAFYRLFDSFLSLSLPNPNEVFGHAYYRHTPAPWAWTQTNMIPRLIADFGSLFWMAMVMIAAIAQWLSLYRFGSSFFGISIRSLMILSSAYSILGIFWFSAFNVNIIFYAFIIYVITKKRKAA